MAEILINSQSPITHKVFWNGDVANADVLPTVSLYDVTLDPAISPTISPTQIITTLTSSLDENNPGTYVVNIPYQYTNRNRTLRLEWNYSVEGTMVKKSDEVFVVTPYVDFNHVVDMNFSTDSSDPGYKSYKELILAEKYARKVIEQHTGQNFYLEDEVFVVYGHDSDILPLPSRVADVYSLYARDVVLFDTIQQIKNWGYDVIIRERLLC